MFKPTQIDPDIRRFAVLNITAAIIGGTHGLLNAERLAQENGIPLSKAVNILAEDFAMAALMEEGRADTFLLPAGSGVSDAVKLFIEGSAAAGREAFEDGLQEGELTSNAIALLSNEPGLWVSDAQDGSEVPFPGTGADGGNGRVNDLVRAAAYVLAEIARIERAQLREAAYAADAAERGVATLPGAGAEDVSTDAPALDAEPETRH